MARKKPSERIAEGSVRAISVERARELITIEPDHSLWKKARANVHGQVKGAIVRLRPPIDATDDVVEAARAWFAQAGAERVVVLPRPKAEIVPQASKDAPERRAVGARQAVRDLIEESSSKDKPALAAFCEKIMAEAGL